MKFNFALLSLPFAASLNLIPLVATHASAQCVVADVAVQAAIHGSKKPAQQTNEVDIATTPSCVGNTSISTSTQVQVGGKGQIIQQRQSRHRIESSGASRLPVAGPTVAVPVQVQVDVYNPADNLNY